MPWVSSFLKYEWSKVPVSDCSDWPRLKSLTNHRTLYSGQIHLSGSSPRYTYFYLRSNSVARNSAQFRENLIASLFAIIAQFRAIKWRKRKQALCAISRNCAQRNCDWKPYSQDSQSASSSCWTSAASAWHSCWWWGGWRLWNSLILKLSSGKVFWFQCFLQITLYVPGVQKLQSCRKFSSLVFLQYFIPEWNLVLNVWFAPQFNTEHCTTSWFIILCNQIKTNPPKSRCTTCTQ